MAVVFPWDREEATRIVVSNALETTEVMMVVEKERAVANLVRARAGVAQRLPPKPPHLTVVLGEAAVAVANGGFTAASPEVARVRQKGEATTLVIMFINKNMELKLTPILEMGLTLTLKTQSMLYVLLVEVAKLLPNSKGSVSL
ncbi:hypothetical protein PIB30_033190 [Stylosanthes scabra]|uniref:Uncharacterized protein n=1 Tax=Stylosanthes scabra TaxID=79078 RepID=A0ABU6QDR4_9FABA|nr:hypothetical protein [Stylosanthes scabra]